MQHFISIICDNLILLKQRIEQHGERFGAGAMEPIFNIMDELRDKTMKTNDEEKLDNVKQNGKTKEQDNNTKNKGKTKNARKIRDKGKDQEFHISLRNLSAVEIKNRYSILANKNNDEEIRNCISDNPRDLEDEQIKSKFWAKTSTDESSEDEIQTPVNKYP